MRVAFLTSGYGDADGVLGRQVQALAEGAAEAGATVDVLLHASGPRIVPPPDPGITVRQFPSLIPGSHYAVSYSLWSYLRRHGDQFDVIHAHGEPVLPALLAAQRTSRRVIFTPHYYASPQIHLRYLVQGRHHRVDHHALSGAGRVLCVSESEALQVQRYAPGARVQIVPNGFDRDSIASAQPFAVDSKLIVSVDRLTRWAGIHRLISALPALPMHYKLAIVGSGRGRTMLEAHAEYLQVSDRVRFLGGVNDAELHRWLRTASVVATLKEESLWGGTLLTAACAGTPVVASDILANREAATLTGSEGICLVSRRASPFAVADAVRLLGGNGYHSTAPMLPSWKDVAQQTLSIYEEVQGNGRRA